MLRADAQGWDILVWAPRHQVRGASNQASSEQFLTICSQPPPSVGNLPWKKAQFPHQASAHWLFKADVVFRAELNVCKALLIEITFICAALSFQWRRGLMDILLGSFFLSLIFSFLLFHFKTFFLLARLNLFYHTGSHPAWIVLFYFPARGANSGQKGDQPCEAAGWRGENKH